jgi:hypothetical protein
MSKHDMMGLEMYDSSYDLGAWLDAETVKAHLMAGASGGVGILLVSTLMGKISNPFLKTDDSGNPTGTAEEQASAAMNWRRTKGVLSVVAGVLGGRLMYDQNRDAAMGFVGGVAGLGFADLIASFVNDPAAPTVRTALSGGYLSGGDLAALEAAVSQAYPAWRPAPEQLMGTVSQSMALSAPMVTTTELGAYAPYLS